MRTSTGFRPRGLMPPDFPQFMAYQRMKEKQVRESMFGQPFTQKASQFMAIHQQALRNQERDVKIKEAKHKRELEAQTRHKQEQKKKKEEKKVLKVIGTETAGGITRPKLDYKKGKNVNDLLKGLANID